MSQVVPISIQIDTDRGYQLVHAITQSKRFKADTTQTIPGDK